MATPRKHWFRVADSILYEGWDPHTTHAVMRLMAHLNTRWAREGLSAEEVSEVVIDGATAQQITSDRREHTALRRLFDLPVKAGIGGMEVFVLVHLAEGKNRSAGILDDDWERARAVLATNKWPTRLLLRWPKFAEFQGLASREQGEESPRVAPSAPAPARRNKTHSSSVSTRKRKRSAVAFPERLSEEDRERLRQWANERQIPLEFVRDKIEDLRLWAQGKDERKADWVAAIQGAVRRDWKEKQRETTERGRHDDTLAGAAERIMARRGLRQVG